MQNEILGIYVLLEEQSPGPMADYMTCSLMKEVIEDNIKVFAEFARYLSVITEIDGKSIEDAFTLSYDEQKGYQSRAM